MSDENYYKVGGSLEYHHPTYVVRQADSELYEGLTNGEFCYVLNSRQMGKSSLRVQMMKKLKEQGFKCASIDMTRIGSHVTPAEWYAGIVSELLRGFGLLKKVNFSTWWREREVLPPLQRLREFIEDVLLSEFDQNFVIFLDEIDSILKIPFKDDFFAFIRACYNQRVDNSEYKRLTFCLLGVATPSDLIADKQRTPFNIGRAIELTGFKLEEAKSSLNQGLAQRVDNPEKVVEAVLAWTGGQPFLTQKLCQLVVEKTEISNPNIEQLVQKHVIENWEAQDEPEHLRTMRDRILSNEQRIGRLLGLYQQILQQGEIAADDSPEQMQLRLSGLVVKQQGKLRFSNRIYASIFNQAWVNEVLANLRPYSQALTIWLASNCQDKSRLLRGQALQDALAWSAGKSLSAQDYQFLTASQEWEIREVQTALELAQIALEAEKKTNQTLTIIQRRKIVQKRTPTILAEIYRILFLTIKYKLRSLVLAIHFILRKTAKVALVIFLFGGVFGVPIFLVIGVPTFILIGVPKQSIIMVVICLVVWFFTVIIFWICWGTIQTIFEFIWGIILGGGTRHIRSIRRPRSSDSTGIQLNNIQGKQRQIAEIIDTDYFQELQKRAKDLSEQVKPPLHRTEELTLEEPTRTEIDEGF